jgi:hypothetical protein
MVSTSDTQLSTNLRIPLRRMMPHLHGLGILWRRRHGQRRLVGALNRRRSLELLGWLSELRRWRDGWLVGLLLA